MKRNRGLDLLSKMRTLLKIGICVACLSGCSTNKLFVGAYNIGERRTNAVEQRRIEREVYDWHGRNKNLPEERREPFEVPGLWYEF